MILRNKKTLFCTIFFIFVTLRITSYYYFTHKFTFLNTQSNVVNALIALAFGLASSIVLTIILYAFLNSRIDKNIIIDKIYSKKMYVIFLVLAGCVVSVLIPLYQVADEPIHMDFIYQQLGLADKNAKNVFAAITNDWGDTSRMITKFDEKVNLDAYLNLNTNLYLPDFVGRPSILLVRHIPQTIGLVIASLLHMPVLLSITFTEFICVAFYVSICFLALKLMPFKKPFMMFLIATPICLQLMGSFSYDVTVISLSFLFISYLLYLKFTKDKITLISIIKLVLLALIIAIIKFPYILLLALLILLPIDKLRLDFKFVIINKNFITKYKKRIIIISIFSIFVIGFLGLYLLRNDSHVKVFLASLLNFNGTIDVLYRTLHNEVRGIEFYIRSITGSFGWLETPVLPQFSSLVFAFSLFFCFANFKKGKADKTKYFKTWEIIFMITLFVVISFSIIIALLEWELTEHMKIDISNLTIIQYAETISRVPIIDGPQGRYFIPILPLLFIPLFSKKITGWISKSNYKFLSVIYYPFILLYICYILLNRFWIS